MTKAAAILIVVLFIFAGPAPPTASALDDPMKGPWCETEARSEEPARGPGGLAVFLVKVYREYLSPIDGTNCPMHPSCSQYSIECFEKHGLFMGVLMTSDRLYRCGRDELARSPWILTNGEAKCYDPVESNDFWLGHEK